MKKIQSTARSERNNYYGIFKIAGEKNDFKVIDIIILLSKMFVFKIILIIYSI
jgi:hypothetical protein